jgi:integrase
MRKRSWPHKVTVGHATVTVYRNAEPDTASGWIYVMAWRTPTGRQREKFTQEEVALREARLKASQLAAGRVETAGMNTSDRDELAAARKAVGTMPLMSALAEWLRARELTNNNVIPAAEAWAARNAAPVEHIKVAEVVRRFLKAKADAGIKTAENHAHIFNDLTRDLGEYDLDTVGAQQLDKWLGRWEHPSTRNTFRKHIVALWRWAQKKGYLSDQIKTEAERTDRAVEAELVPGIINADTFERLLLFFRRKHPEYLPALVLAGFTGMRRSEIHDQLWSDINLAAGHLKVTKAKRGTPSRRLVPLCSSCVEWLMLAPDKTEYVCGNLALDRIRKIASEANDENGMPLFTELPDNCFRHAFISHRVAATGDIARTSLEAGNSADMVRKHYLELVTKQDGEAWFAIRPRKPARIVAIATGKAANA